jgi:hypothetical protein
MNGARKIVETLTLTKPIVLKARDGRGQEVEERIEVLEFVELKGKHLRGLPLEREDYNVGTILDLAAALAGVSSAVLDELDPDDVTRVAEVAGRFLSGGPRTGTKPPPP